MLPTTHYILGVKVDFLAKKEAVNLVQGWLSKKGKHYITTPNPEMLIDAQNDKDFKSALNESSLSLADSSRLAWAALIKNTKDPLLRFFYYPLFLFPKPILSNNRYPVTAGVDLMEELIRVSEEKAFITAFLGGTPKVADRLYKCLRQKYPKLKIAFCSGNVIVDQNGKTYFDTNKDKKTQSNNIKLDHKPVDTFNAHKLNQKIDILFVAFGHSKQEKWMQQSLPKLSVRVMMGVGGSFDYLSGVVPRAPKILRDVGLEWLFRLIIQPWRINRFWKLGYFVCKVINSK